MSELGNRLYNWLDEVDLYNEIEWYEHVIAKNFACGCRPWKTYCAEWTNILNKVGSETFWIQTNSMSVTDAMIRTEASRRKYVVLNSWQNNIAKALKSYNPNIKCFVYKCASSTRSYDSNSNWQMLPAGVSYQYANANKPSWFLTNKTSGQRIQWSYPGHWQMDVGNAEYQNMWANNVIGMKDYGFDGIWIDNCLWRRSDYNAYPGKYATDIDFRNAYVSFFNTVTAKIKSAGMLSIGNLNGARRVTGGWDSYLNAGLDGGFDEFWLSVDNTGNNLLPEYSEGWSRLVNQISFAESKNKIALVQPHFPAGHTRAFNYTYASYLMGAGKNSAFTEANGTDTYNGATPWHEEYDWYLGEPLGARYRPTSNANVWKRDFTNGTTVVNANTKDSVGISVALGGTYFDKAGSARQTVSLIGCSGAVFRK